MGTAACKTQSSEGSDAEETEVAVIPEFSDKFFVGTYTRDEGWVVGKAEGIYSGEVTDDGETLAIEDLAAEVVNPSFVTISPDKKHLYAVSELGRSDESTGYIYAYNIDSDQSLDFIDRYPTNGKSPAYITLDPSGELVIAANYQGGKAILYSRDATGRLTYYGEFNHFGSGTDTGENGSHLHMIKFSPDNKFMYIPDLGNDRLWVYQYDIEQGTFTEPAKHFMLMNYGDGPRHMDFRPDGKFAYVINELSSTISVFSVNSGSGNLLPVQRISTLPESFSGWNSTADIHVHPSGKFLYGSNRGHNSIASYAINEEDGTLTLIGHTSTEGEFPRNFAIHPDGDFLYAANQNTDNITVFSIDEVSGALTYTGESIEVSTPVCIAFY